MAPLQDHQVEKVVDEALKHNDFQALQKFLQNETKEETVLKCSRQFMTKLDKLFVREIDLGNVDHACLVLTILHKHGDMLVFPGGVGMSVMVSQGFVKKWFEKARKLWVKAGSSKNETLIKLAEDFFDALMVVHESCKQGKYEVTETLLSHIGKLASNAQINIIIQKEAARKLNAVLAEIPMELKKKKKILSSQEASSMTIDVASRILKGGDYDLQVSLMEALCRMASPAQRNELADSWFAMTFVSSAFRKIKDSEFETDCRKFLNLVNGMQGDKRSVYSYPCLGAFLDKQELFMPEDENLEAFWIDFNLESQSISFYFSLNKDVKDGKWNTLCVVENEVQSYTVEGESGRKILHVLLTESVNFDSVEGSRVIIKFSSSLDILQATERVFGQAKNKASVRKISIAKTPVYISLNSQESTQVFVPESQMSPSLCVEGRGSLPSRHDIQHLTPDANNAPQQMVTPVTMKVSESCTYITGSVGRQQGSCSSSCVLPAFSKPMVKPALQMMSSSERKKEIELRDLMMSKTSCNVSSLSVYSENNQKKAHVIAAQSTPAAQNEDQQNIQNKKLKAQKYHKHIPVEKVVEMVQADKHEEDAFDNSIVPDSQQRKRSLISPGLWSLNSSKRRISVSESLLTGPRNSSKNSIISDGGSHPPPQRLSPAQCAPRTLTQKQLHTRLTLRLEEVLKEQQGTDGHTAQQGSSLEPRSAGQEKEDVEKSVRTISGPARPTQQKMKSRKVQDEASGHENMAHTADGMVKMISSHYKRSAKAASSEPGAQFNSASTNRYLFNKSCGTSSMEKTDAKSSSLNKTHDPFQKLEDVYAFKADTPKISVRKKSDASRVESSNSPTRSKSTKRPNLPKATTTNVKKNLFSDTDTDNMTDISWLKSANRKPKPKVADYSRQPVKPTAQPADASFKSPHTPLPLPRPVKEQIKPKRKRQKKVAEHKDKQQPSINKKKATGRPQRATALTRTYRDPSDSDSLSDTEKAPPPKKKAVVQPAGLQEMLPARAAGKGERMEKTSVAEATQHEKNVQKMAGKAFVKIKQVQRNDKGIRISSPETLIMKESAQGSPRHKESWAARLSSTFASPPSIEKMRSDEKLTTNFRSNTTPLHSLSISPIEADSPPPVALGPLKEIQASTLYRTPGSLCSVKPSHSITPVSTASRGSKKNPPAPQVVLSPVHSILTQTQPLIISETNISADLQEEPRSALNRISPTSIRSETRSVISVTMSQSSHISFSNTAPMCPELEKTPPHQQGSSLDKSEFKSGPTAIPTHAIPCNSATLSEEEEDSEEDKENKAPSPSQLALKMKPRKLFVPTDKHWTPSMGLKMKQLIKDPSSSEEEEEDVVLENGRRKKSYQRGLNKRAKETTISTEDVETLSSCTRSSFRNGSAEADMDPTQPSQEVRVVFHQFSSELKRKNKNRSRTLDVYTRQSMKTLQQHMSSISVQVHQYSSQRLEKVKQVLLGEIENLEQDDVALRSMEEDLMTYWEKQTSAFHTYQEKRGRRLQKLKSTVWTDVCDSLEYEERIFSVEMSLMKKNMKSVQDRFFKEMHDEELTSVRRGLQSLFFRDASSF